MKLKPVHTLFEVLWSTIHTSKQFSLQEKYGIRWKHLDSQVTLDLNSGYSLPVWEWWVEETQKSSRFKECEQLDMETYPKIPDTSFCWRLSVPCADGLWIWVVAFICVRVFPLGFYFCAPSPISPMPTILQSLKEILFILFMISQKYCRRYNAFQLEVEHHSITQLTEHKKT